MIAWKEEVPDFRRKPADDLLAAMPFTTAVAVLLAPEGPPMIAATRPVLSAIWDHLSERNVEMGGLLIGKVHDLDPSTFVVSVEDFARGEEFDGTSVSLRLDAAVWEAARMKLAKDRCVIGWYHSHPNLGAFFSGTDRRTQASFFNQPHSVGLVIDPIRREEKWFIGSTSEEVAPGRIVRWH
jgi:proteasome lid subunit RPN8/RPN11